MVSIIIINYNTFQLTCNCIASVLQFTNEIEYEIILVDNASTECNPDLFTQQFPAVKLVKSNFNTGFAGGNNLGIEAAKGNLILLVNSDTVFTEDAVSKTAVFLQCNDTIGVIGCRMTYPDGKVQHTARKFRSVKWELLDLFRPVLFLLPYKKRAELMLGKYFNADFNIACDWLNGAFFMFRKEILYQLPDKKLDNRFFMYGEDHLWCWQIKQLGYQNYFYCGASITHINSGSTIPSKRLGLRRLMMKHELEIMKERNGNGFYFSVFKFLFTCKENGRYVIKWVISKVNRKS